MKSVGIYYSNPYNSSPPSQMNADIYTKRENHIIKHNSPSVAPVSFLYSENKKGTRYRGRSQRLEQEWAIFQSIRPVIVAQRKKEKMFLYMWQPVNNVYTSFLCAVQRFRLLYTPSKGSISDNKGNRKLFFQMTCERKKNLLRLLSVPQPQLQMDTPSSPKENLCAPDVHSR
jgi:hypothetical protein